MSYLIKEVSARMTLESQAILINVRNYCLKVCGVNLFLLMDNYLEVINAQKSKALTLHCVKKYIEFFNFINHLFS